MLLKKYNVAGPRYTSYPTVPYWETYPTQEEWIQGVGDALRAARSEGIGAALYVHVPFCESLCTYCGCNTRITRNRSVGGPYLGTLLKEWELYLSRLELSRIPIEELHLGGGTPTFLTADELERLVMGILERAEVSSTAEFSLEADPRVTTREQLEKLRRMGFRRLSLGIQDFDPKVQAAVSRVQSERQVRAVTEQARELGYTSVNYDLIYGLPFQTEASVTGTIEATLRLRPDRIAFYAYAHVPWIKPGHRRFTDEDIPSADAKRALYEIGRRFLAGGGYREIGMDHFALQTDSLWKAVQAGTLHRNFMGYIPRRVAPLIGLGVSSIGDSWSAFAQNEKLLETYVSRVEAGELPIHRGHVLTAEDRVLRRHILDLMTRFETSWEAPELRTGFLESVPERLLELARDGLVEVSARSCKVTEAGRPFLRNICMAFDARLVRKAPATQLFSRTI